MRAPTFPSLDDIYCTQFWQKILGVEKYMMAKMLSGERLKITKEYFIIKNKGQQQKKKKK